MVLQITGRIVLGPGVPSAAFPEYHAAIFTP
jgi:hypothetical protein